MIVCESRVFSSYIFDFIDEQQHKIFAKCYSQKMVFQIWFFFNVSYWEIKGVTELFYQLPVYTTTETLT